MSPNMSADDGHTITPCGQRYHLRTPLTRGPTLSHSLDSVDRSLLGSPTSTRTVHIRADSKRVHKHTKRHLGPHTASCLLAIAHGRCALETAALHLSPTCSSHAIGQGTPHLPHTLLSTPLAPDVGTASSSAQWLIQKRSTLSRMPRPTCDSTSSKSAGCTTPS